MLKSETAYESFTDILEIGESSVARAKWTLDFLEDDEDQDREGQP